MARLFYTTLFGVTASLAATLWLRHGPPTRWLRAFEMPQALAQLSYPLTGQGEADPPAEPAQPTSQPVYPTTAESFDGAVPRMIEYGEAGREQPASDQPDSNQPVPGQPARNQPDPNQSGAHPAPARSGGQPPLDASLLDNTKVLAKVGQEVILAGDVLGKVNEVLALYASKLRPEVLARITADDWEAQRELLIPEAVKQLVDVKMIVADAREKIPPENFDKITDKLAEAFEKDELDSLMRQWQARSRPDLDTRLRRFGSSVEREKRSYIESMLARQWQNEQLKLEGEITHDEMLAYYEQHRADFEYPAQARWEHLMVRFSSYASKAEAWAALAQMGNQVMDGAPLGDVAKARSDGPTAAQGGHYDWTTQGSLVSDVLDQALFSLPVGALSERLVDDRGFHVVRVLERRDAGRIPFTEAQGDIRKRIAEQRFQRQRERYLAELKEKVPVWTVYDNALARQ